MWDKENNRLLCKFENGIFETSEERTIKILSSLDYKFEAEKEAEEEIIISKPRKKIKRVI